MKSMLISVARLSMHLVIAIFMSVVHIKTHKLIA